MTILTLAGMESISKTLYESANIDGADFFQKTRYITMPLAKGPILTGLLITSVFSFRTIDAIFSLTKGGPARGTYVLGMLDLDYIYNYIQFGKAGAVSVYLLLMCLAIAGIYIYFLLKE
jgi:multiple sugar transport system permease protein